MADPLRALVKRIRNVEKLAFRAATQPQLAYATIEDGAMQARDSSGSLTLIVGKQFDGTQTVSVVNGPPPPQPTTPVCFPTIGGAEIRWDGLWTNGDITPMNYGRVEVHASVDPAFVPNTAATLVGFFESPRGGAVYPSLVPNDYTIKFVAVSQSGVRGTPSPSGVVSPTDIMDVIADPGGHSLEPPTSTPTLTVNPGPVGFTLRVDDADPTVTISYHAAEQTDTVVDFTPGPTTLLLGPTRRNPVYIGTFPDGSHFDPNKTYMFKAVAHRAGVDAPPSALVTGTLELISSDQIVSLDVDKLEAGNILVKGDLEATYALLGLLQVGTNITIDPDDGITIKTSDGKITHLAANGSGNRFAGEGTFDSITILDNLTLTGLNNFFNGLFTLANGVSDPRQKVTVTSSYDSNLAQNGNPGFDRRGMTDDGGGGWISTETVGTIGGSVQIWGKHDNFGISLFDIEDDWLPLGGVTRIGTRYYVLAAHNDGGTWVRNNWRILMYDTASPHTYRGSIPISNGGAYTSPGATPMIGTDGTRLITALVNTGGDLYIREYNTDGSFSSSLKLVSGWGASRNVTSVNKSSIGLAATRYVVSDANGIYTYSSTVAESRQSADEWPKAPGIIQGLLAGSDGEWHQFSRGNAWYDFNHLNKGQWDFSYAWVDSNNGSGDQPPPYIDAQTKLAPYNTISPTKFAKWTMTLPSAPPDDNTVNGANTAALYAAPSGSPLIRQTVLLPGVLAQTYTSLLTSGTTHPGVSGFATRTGALGRIASVTPDSLGNPILVMDGAGNFRAAKFLQSNTYSAANAANDTNYTYRVDFPVPFDSIPKVLAEPNTTLPHLVFASAASIDVNGFSIVVRRAAGAGTANTNVVWHATTAS